MYIFFNLIVVFIVYRVVAVVIIVNPGLVEVRRLLKLVIGLNIQVLQAKNTIIIVKLKCLNGINQENG